MVAFQRKGVAYITAVAIARLLSNIFAEFSLQSIIDQSVMSPYGAISRDQWGRITLAVGIADIPDMGGEAGEGGEGSDSRQGDESGAAVLIAKCQGAIFAKHESASVRYMTSGIIEKA